MQDTTLLVSAPVVFQRKKDKPIWFIVKRNEESEWEIPKVPVRRVESSVRAAIRSMAEEGGMDAKVMEEVGRCGGATKVNGKPVSQRFLYYLMAFNDGGEVLGYHEHQWLEYAKASRLISKRDRGMLRSARVLLKQLDKKAEAEERIKKISLNLS